MTPGFYAALSVQVSLTTNKVGHEKKKKKICSHNCEDMYKAQELIIWTWEGHYAWLLGSKYAAGTLTAPTKVLEARFSFFSHPFHAHSWQYILSSSIHLLSCLRSGSKAASEGPCHDSSVLLPIYFPYGRITQASEVIKPTLLEKAFAK